MTETIKHGVNCGCGYKVACELAEEAEIRTNVRLTIQQNQLADMMAMRAEIEALKASNHGWISANAPGGWIDDLRTTVARLEGLIAEWYDSDECDDLRELPATEALMTEAQAIKARSPVGVAGAGKGSQA